MALFRRKVTAEQLGTLLAAAVMKTAFEGENSVHGIVQKWGTVPTTVQYYLECIFFAAFPLDMIVAKETGPHADAVRVSMRSKLTEGINSIISSAGKNPFSHAEFEDRIGDRVEEYAGYIRDSWDSGEGTREKAMMDFAWSAYRNITNLDKVDPAPAMGLTMLWSASMANMPKAILAYRIVT